MKKRRKQPPFGMAKSLKKRLEKPVKTLALPPAEEARFRSPRSRLAKAKKAGTYRPALMIGDVISILNNPEVEIPRPEILKKFLEKTTPFHLKMLRRTAVEKIDGAVRFHPEIKRIWEEKKRQLLY